MAEGIIPMRPPQTRIIIAHPALHSIWGRRPPPTALLNIWARRRRQTAPLSTWARRRLTAFTAGKPPARARGLLRSA